MFLTQVCRLAQLKVLKAYPLSLVESLWASIQITLISVTPAFFTFLRYLLGKRMLKNTVLLAALVLL